ncbi:MAG: ribosome silencing factor [Candidatus Omnitrophota bacterium]
MDSKRKAYLVADFALDKKAEDLVVLDMHKVSSFCDYFIICSASSTRQVRAIADGIEEGLVKLGISPRSVEGKSDGVWLLLDYADIIVHIFYAPMREFYELEKLWQDAKKVRLSTLRKNEKKGGRRNNN